MVNRVGQRLVTRVGVQRVVAEVRLAHVGLIVGLERRRLARANTDGHP